MKILSTLAFVLAANFSVAQVAEPQAKNALVEDTSVKVRAGAIIEEFKQKTWAFDQKIKAESDESVKKSIEAQRPNLRHYVESVLELLKAEPEADGTISALVWVCRFGGEDQQKEARALMFAKYKKSKELQHYVDSLMMSYLGEVDKLREVVAVSEDESVKLDAKYQLGRALLNQNKRNSSLTAQQKEQNSKEALRCFKEVKAGEQWGKKTPRLEKVLDGRIFQLEKLAVGKVVPEIVGVDHAGIEFRLSDYRGKAVMLDFWGYW